MDRVSYLMMSHNVEQRQINIHEEREGEREKEREGGERERELANQCDVCNVKSYRESPMACIIVLTESSLGGGHCITLYLIHIWCQGLNVAP